MKLRQALSFTIYLTLPSKNAIIQQKHIIKNHVTIYSKENLRKFAALTYAQFKISKKRYQSRITLFQLCFFAQKHIAKIKIVNPLNPF